MPASQLEPDLRFPIGRFVPPVAIRPADREAWIAQVAATPGALRRAVGALSDEQLDTAYRPGGWTVRQLVHHVADSHINAYVRTRLALTEDTPTIRPYDEKRWAALADGDSAPVELSLLLLESLHARWVLLLRSLDDAGWARAYHHPEIGTVPLGTMLAMYAWHGRHHVAHVTALRERMRWG